MRGLVFDVASVSKQFTAASAALLIEQGKLSEDDDVRKWVPELPDYDAALKRRLRQTLAPTESR